jgi:N6-L-threonylcarbamoyladenine synthase
VLAGGVSANSMLREKTVIMAEELNCELHIPRIEYCTDNAAMIAITGSLLAKRDLYADLDMKPFASL